MNIYKLKPTLLVPVSMTASMLPFVTRAIEYAMLQRYAPAIFIASVIPILGMAKAMGKTPWNIARRCWGLVLLIYGTLRTLIVVALAFAPVNSTHAIESTSLTYLLTSLALLGLGIVILRAKLE